MPPGITTDDLERIDRFVRQPRYRRRPAMLLPEADNCPDGATDD